MKRTAITHANFSPPVVLFELIIINIGSSQTKPITARNKRMLRPELSILSITHLFLHITPAFRRGWYAKRGRRHLQRIVSRHATVSPVQTGGTCRVLSVA
jgi:hypothetical protein